MDCKGCGKRLAEEEGHAVAHWKFCDVCFATLMEKKAEPEPPSVDELPVETSSAPVEEASPVFKRCVTCDVLMREGEEITMLGLSFCKACHEKLTELPEIRPIPEEEEPPPQVEQIVVDTMKTVECSECGRTIPELGQKLLDGKPHCPDCYYKKGA